MKREIALLYISLGETEQAKEVLKEVLSLSRAIKNPEIESHALYELSGIALNHGNLIEARNDIEASIALIETIRLGVSGDDLRTSYFARVRDYYDRYVEVLMRDHAQRPGTGLDVLALKVSDRARARSMLDLMNEARVNIREGVAPALLQQERNLHQRLNAKEAQRTELLSAATPSPRLKVLEKELADLVTEFHNVRARLRDTSPRYAELTQPKPFEIAEIQNALDQETIVLEYLLGNRRSFLWVVTPQSVQSFELPPREKIETTARRLYELVTARNSFPDNESSRDRRVRITKADEDFYTVADELSEMILGPAAGLLSNKRLLVVAEGALQYLPLAALPEPQRQLTKQSRRYLPLAATHEVVSLPSLSVMMALRGNQSSRHSEPKSIAVIADPIFSINDLRVTRNKPTNDSQPTASTVGVKKEIPLPAELQRFGDDSRKSFSRLPFTRREANEISAIVPERSRMVALDFAANKETALSPNLSKFGIVHFATHGILNSERPELSGLVFSLVDENGNPRDGFLRLHEIFNLKLNSELVVLSACQTALGREIRGEGLIGLTRGFMYAGAPRVVAGLWRVDDRATAQLMRQFYQRMLIDGVRPAAALRAAQQSLAKEERWKSPYYWAPFVIQGDWR